MATSLGSSASVSTWGKFRCAYAKNVRDCTVNEFNVTYVSGMKSAALGSGLIRIKTFNRTAFAVQPCFQNLYEDPLSGDYNALYLTPELFASATVETESELTGETVNLTNGTMVISSALFNSSGQQFYADGSLDFGTIIDIGKLTAF